MNIFKQLFKNLILLLLELPSILNTPNGKLINATKVREKMVKSELLFGIFICSLSV